MTPRSRYLRWAVALLAANLFAAWYVGQERTLYTWDYSNYWVKTVALYERATESPFRALSRVYKSIRHDEYNLLASVPLVPFQAVGDSRTMFLCGMATMFLVPAVLVFARLVEELAGPLNRWQRGSLLAAGLLFAPLWIPLLRGYPAVMGTVFAGAILLWYLRCPLDAMTPRQACGLGLLLLGIFLTRRYYAFWVVGFFLAAATIEVVRANGAEARWTQLRRAGQTLLIAGGTALAYLLLFALPTLRRTAGTDYAELYAPWQSGTAYAERLMQLFGQYGYFVLLAAAVGLMVFAAREPQHRKFVALLVLQTALAALLFCRVQVAGVHHALLVAPALLVGVGLFVVQLPAVLGRWPGGAVGGATVAVLAAQFAGTFSPTHASAEWLEIAGLTPHPPLVRGDLAVIDRLRERLNELAGGDAPKAVYIVGSSTRFNEGLFSVPARIEPAKRPITFRPLAVHDVETRDGWPLHIVEASYIVVTDPPQIHLEAKDQQAVLAPAAMLASGTSLGRYYRRLREPFALDDGLTAWIYARTEPIDAAGRAAFEQALHEAATRYR